MICGASLFLLPAILARGFGQTPPATESPWVAGMHAPGSTLTISVPPSNDTSTKDISSNITLVPLGPGRKYTTTGTKVDNGIEVTLPSPGLDPGNYRFIIGDKTDVLGSIDVEQDNVKIGSVYPTTAYHEDKRDLQLRHRRGELFH